MLTLEWGTSPSTEVAQDWTLLKIERLVTCQDRWDYPRMTSVDRDGFTLEIVREGHGTPMLVLGARSLLPELLSDGYAGSLRHGVLRSAAVGSDTCLGSMSPRSLWTRSLTMWRRSVGRSDSTARS